MPRTKKPIHIDKIKQDFIKILEKIDQNRLIYNNNKDLKGLFLFREDIKRLSSRLEAEIKKIEL